MVMDPELEPLGAVMGVRDPDLELNSSLRSLKKETGRLVWNCTVQYGHQHPHMAVEMQTTNQMGPLECSVVCSW